MRFNDILKRLCDLEEAYNEACFSVTLERAIFKRGEGRVTGRILIRPGQGDYVAI